MYWIFISGELKKWMRDPMTRFMLFYPLLFGVIGRYALPVIADNSGFSIESNADFILVALTLMMPIIYGAVIGFSILDDRDDQIINSVRITPLNLNFFMIFRLAMVYLLAFAASIFVMWFVEIGTLAWKDILLIAFLASFSAPLTGLLINIFANNKIEGFAIMKLVGMIIILPIISLFFNDARELFFAVIPAFWPGKIISALIHGEGQMFLSSSAYFWVGLLYILILNLITYRRFSRKITA